MVVGIVNYTELTWGNTVDSVEGMYGVLSRGGFLNSGTMVFGSVTNLERHLLRQLTGGEEMEVADREVCLVGGVGVVAMTDVENVCLNVFPHYKPRSSAETHSLALSNGVEPKSTVLTYALACL